MMEWAIYGAVFVLVVLALGILSDNLRQKRKIQAQELVRKDRLYAMEKGLPLPEWDGDLLSTDVSDAQDPVTQRRRVEWFRFTALCAGLVLSFGGLGMGLAFHFSTDSEFNKMATLGFIPLMTGLGLLSFYGLTRMRDD